MIKIENDNKYKVGDEVWFFDQYDNLRGGTITEFKTSEQAGDEYANVRLDKTEETGHMHAPLDKCWPTKDACLDAEHRRSEAQVQEYKDGITDVESLVKFMYNMELVSEFPDYDARKAAKEKAGELLGVNVEPLDEYMFKPVEVLNKGGHKLGDDVWWLDPYGNLCNGTIYEITNSGNKPVALINSDGADRGAQLYECWPSKAACLNAERQRSEQQVKVYKDAIPDVEGLVRFMYNNDINSEDKDYEARTAVLERANDLLGIDLTATDEMDFAQAVESIDEQSAQDAGTTLG